MIKSIKKVVSLFAVVALLAACTSNQEVEPVATPTPEPTSDTTATTTESTDITIGVDTVFYFEFDQSILSSAARSALTIHAEALGDSPMSVRLEGHADERGSREYNMALGERRANAVRDFLVLQGVDASMIETVSYGEERPAEVGSYDSAWSKNRRVEMTK